MRFGHVALIAHVVILVIAVSPTTAAIPLPNTAQCTGHIGFLRDKDPVGRVVRVAPSIKSAKLGVIAPPIKSPNWGRDIYAGFRIIGSRNGWLLIEGGGDQTALTELPARTMYNGRGWISGRGVFVNLQTSRGFLAPTHSSERIIQTPTYMDIDQHAAQLGVSGCQGDWVLIDWKPFNPSRNPDDPETLTIKPPAELSAKPLTLRAWSTGVCDIQETSCEGLNGDEPGPPEKSSKPS
jgi:hypothetical protein